MLNFLSVIRLPILFAFMQFLEEVVVKPADHIVRSFEGIIVKLSKANEVPQFNMQVV